MNEQKTPEVYSAISKVQSALAKHGITKDKKNQAQGYNFRGIDDVYFALAPLLSEHGLCILPRFISRTVSKEVNAKGTTLFYVVVEAEFDFVSVSDGSIHVVKTFGEAMDSGDKATNKAMSAAYKYAAFQAFSIPTEGDNDADAHTHQVSTRQEKPAEKQLTFKAQTWSLVRAHYNDNATAFESGLKAIHLLAENETLAALTEDRWKSIFTQLSEHPSFKK